MSPYRAPRYPAGWEWVAELEAAPLATLPLSGAALAASWGSAVDAALRPPRFPRFAGTSSGGPR